MIIKIVTIPCPLRTLFSLPSYPTLVTAHYQHAIFTVVTGHCPLSTPTIHSGHCPLSIPSIDSGHWSLVSRRYDSFFFHINSSSMCVLEDDLKDVEGPRRTLENNSHVVHDAQGPWLCQKECGGYPSSMHIATAFYCGLNMYWYLHVFQPSDGTVGSDQWISGRMR
jgi:hypothetical protein